MNLIKQQRAVVRLLLCVVGAFLLLACQTVGERSETFNSAEFTLPATFKGTLPCADCQGIHYHLDLWPDGVFHLRQTYLGTPGVADDRGRWQTDPSRSAILLYGTRERKLQFEVKGAHTIRLLDQQGRPIQSSLPYDLTSEGTLRPTDLSLDLHGMFRYMADAAQFEDCLTARFYPVAMEGDYIKLERAYLQAAKPEPGAPLMATFAGDITRRPAMEAMRWSRR